MSSFKRFDVAAELQNLGYTPAKIAKPAKVTPSAPSQTSNFSNFSRFSRDETVKLKNPDSIDAPAWPCPHCGREAEIEAVEPSLDGERMLTYWHCEPCQSYAVTPSTIKEPPAGWGTKREQ